MKKRLLLLSEEMGPGGGGKGVAAHVLQTLSQHYDVTLLCYSPPDCEATDQWCDTRLADCRWQYLGPTTAERLLIRAIPDPTRFQRVNVLQKRARRIAGQFDAAFACCSLECDLGRPAIQYLHYPYLGHSDWRNQVPGDSSWPKLTASLLQRRTPPWMAISRFSFDRMRRNLTLTNSHWTAGRIRELYDMPSVVVYPPAAGCARSLPWSGRRNGFVAIGRMEAGKRFDWMIETMTRVRSKVPDVELHICTHRDDVWAEPATEQRVAELAQAAGDWVHVHYNLSRDRLSNLLAENRFGLHAKIDEHFGMAPAEMARAGCLPFVHDSGGQVEIVDEEPRLRYGSAEEAVEKIVSVLQSPTAQEELREIVGRRAELFSPEAFAGGLLENVDRFLAHRAAAPAKEGSA
ncbi:MAG: glycosyltransferase [Acidobacteria bacterium]|nr:glycosyltransferase [Acidobacteriota bacterium]